MVRKRTKIYLCIPYFTIVSAESNSSFLHILLSYRGTDHNQHWPEGLVSFCVLFEAPVTHLTYTKAEYK